jgi:predicted dehydrogenase
MLDMRGLDAVVISTPDHTHAVATLRALQLGKHVYCEKPLTHTVLEARRVAEAAAKAKVATQLGIQIHAERNYRRVVEWVRAGAIGPVREVHVCCSKSWGGATQPQGHPPVPSTLHYDLWLGPTRQRVYHPEYVPENWRRWWQFGGGTLADMGCHYLDLVHWALDLRHPIRVSAEGPPPHPEATPAWMIAQYEYPARDSQPPVKVSWHDGGKRPPIMMEGAAAYRNGVLFMGDKGMLFADYRQRILLPETRFESYVPPAPTIPDSPGHYQEWIEACKTGKTTSCDFAYGGALTEAVLLGNVAYRTGHPITWDTTQLKATDCPKAMEYVHQAYRAGWSI